MKHLRNLTLASAKHLVSQGHISSAQHRKIVKKVKAAPAPMDAEMPPEAMMGQLGPAAAPMVPPSAPMAASGAAGMLGPMLQGM